jgi:ATP synthase protein I
MAKNWHKAVFVASSTSTTLAALVVGGYFLGNYLDERWDVEPLFTISLMISGLIMGVIHLVVTLIKEYGE